MIPASAVSVVVVLACSLSITMILDRSYGMFAAFSYLLGNYILVIQNYAKFSLDILNLQLYFQVQTEHTFLKTITQFSGVRRNFV